MAESGSVREKLGMSLMEIAERKHVDKISVREICEGCGLSTRTFYNNFRDKYDLITWVYTSHYERIMQDRMEIGSIAESIVACLCELREHAPFYRNVVANTHGLDSFEKMVLGHARAMMLDYLQHAADGDNLDETVRFSVDFFLHAVSACMLDWLRADDPMDPEEFAGLCVANLPGLLRPYFG